VKLLRRDYALAVWSRRLDPMLRQLGEFETAFFRRRLAGIEVDRPVFICGLARAGTTILLELLATCRGVATHRYRDFPFLWTPILWNRFQDRFGSEAAPRERPHRDRIRITRESPEAFEEPLWRSYFPWLHDPDRSHRLTDANRDASFDQAFRDHIRKIVMLRRGRRYLSKANYNVARIEYLADLFPDARFIVPVRDPVAQVCSLVRQHALFSDYSKADPRAARYLAIAGHYEFGPQRVPINLDDRAMTDVLAAWPAGDEFRGYAILWRRVAEHVLALADRTLSERVMLVRHEDLCGDPAGTFAKLAAFARLEIDRDASAGRLADIAPTARAEPGDRALAAIREETGAVAPSLGYRF